MLLPITRLRLPAALTAFFGAVLLLYSASVAGADPHIPAPHAPDVAVAPGAIITTTIGPLPGGVREVELYLLTDDGARLVRLSPETEARAGRITWRMPRLHGATARLALRAGGEHGEWESAPSARFAIADEAIAPGHSLIEAIAGRQDDSDPAFATCAAPSGMHATPEAGSLAPGQGTVVAIVSPRDSDDALLAYAPQPALFPEAASPPAPARLPDARDNRPSSRPLRN